MYILVLQVSSIPLLNLLDLGAYWGIWFLGTDLNENTVMYFRKTNSMQTINIVKITKE